VEKNGVSFSVMLKKKKVSFHSGLIGGHMIENILPGIYLGHLFGMSDTELKEAVAKLSALPKTMIIQKSLHGITLVDDTFNVNPQGVIAAMDYAQVYKGKKYLVLEPMIELGSSGKDEHRKVGQMIANTCDYVFLTKKNFASEVMQGITDKKGKCVVQVMKPKDIAAFITTHATKADIAVFEGKEAAVALHHIV
jgi:UDP-N-acetylmuramyl pentapeptide synthase